MKTRAPLASGCAFLLAILSAGCPSETEGPLPSTRDVDPQVICNQAETWIVLSGTGFSPAPADALTESPLMALPQVTLTHSADFDGSEIEPSVFVLNEDASDPSNTRVKWLGSTTLTFLVDPDLGLPSGVYDILVQNPTGGEDLKSRALTAVPPPILESALPFPICTAQYENEIVLRGQWLLSIGEESPTVSIGEASYSASSMEECAEVYTERGDVRSCNIMRVLLGIGEVGVGTHEVVVTNPAPASCTSSEVVVLHVLPPPTLEEISPDPVCVAQADTQVTVSGTGFLRLDGDVPAVSVGTVSLTNVVLLEDDCEPLPEIADAFTCSRLQATLPMGSLDVDGGPYSVVVTNPAPAGCATSEAVELHVSPPPDVHDITPTEICSGGGIFTITGVDLQGISAYLMDPEGRSVHPTSVTIDDEGTQATIAFSAGLRNTVYDLHVTGAGGCSDVLASAITVNLGPVVYYLDPPVAYNGIPIRATIYGSGLVEQPLSVNVAPAGGGEESELLDVSWNPDRPNVIMATIPPNLDPGPYDVFIRGADGCDSLLPEGLTVLFETKLALLEPAITPPFGHESENVAVNIVAKPDSALVGDEVNFLATPRVYLSSAELQTAAPLRALVFDSSSQLAAVVPPLPAGIYDLVVINPGEPATVGFAAGAYESVGTHPPVVVEVLPTKVDKAAGQVVTVNGHYFFDPEVSVECEDGTAPPVVVDTVTSTDISLTVTIDASTVNNGAVCVVRVSNSSNGTWDEYFSLSVTTPAGNISPFRPSFVNQPEQVAHLNFGRRAPAVASGRATRKSRFLYAIGGDDGTSAGAYDSVEVAALGRFGEIGSWSVLQTALPQERTLAEARASGGFLYMLGGMDTAGEASAEVLRAAILDPLEGPDIIDVNLRFAEAGDGLGAGAWTYMVAAVMSAGDTENPGGETLPSEAVTLYAPLVPDGVEIELTWNTVLASDSITPAAEYRIYRTLHQNEGGRESRLLALVPGTASLTHSFVDLNPAAFANEEKKPLGVGALGTWHLHDLLNTPRASFGFVEVGGGEETGCEPYWYVFGGITDTDTQSMTYEVFGFSGGVPLTPMEFTATGDITPRREHGLWAASQGNSTATTLGACEFYLFTGSGTAGLLESPTIVNSVRVAKYSAATGGELGSFINGMQSGSIVDYSGYRAFWSGDRAYNMGGIQGGIMVNNVMDGRWTTQTEPKIQNMTSSGQGLNEVRHLYGFTRIGNVVYLVGGSNTSDSALTSSEYNVR